MVKCAEELELDLECRIQGPDRFHSDYLSRTHVHTYRYTHILNAHTANTSDQ